MARYQPERSFVEASAEEQAHIITLYADDEWMGKAPEDSPAADK